MPPGLNLSNINYEIWKNSSDNLFQNQGFINENLFNKQNSSDTHSVSSKSNEFNPNSLTYSNSNNLNKKYDRNNLSKDFLSKIRRRSIKNNKIVFVHPHKALKQNMAANNEATHMNTSVVINNVTTETPNNNVVGTTNHQDIIKIEPGNNQKDDNMTIYSFNEKESINQSYNKGKFALILAGKKPRGSRYRGVSRNGNQWQVLIMVNKKKRYVGSYSNEEEAARAYDKAALQNHGSKAKTNYDYSEEELNRITNEPPILKIQEDK
jgi:hypothetical protein